MATVNVTMRKREGSFPRVIGENARLVTVYGVLVIIVLGTSLISPTFRSPDNIITLFKQAVVPGIIALAQTIVILAGGIDLSVGSLLTLISLVTAGMMDSRDDRMLPAVLLALGIGLATGLINGIVITRAHVAPFIMTLGMYSILQGVALAYTTVPLGGIAPSLGDALYYGQLGAIPYSLFYFAIIFLALLALLRLTPFGRAIYAVGGKDEVARRAGIKVERVRLTVYLLCGFLVALASLIATARMGVGDPLAGQGMELDSITAVVIGGTSLFGGRGSLLGTLAGVLILGLINNIMIILGVSMFYQQLIKGIIVLVAVAIYKQRT